ncbi:exonuclease subunit SbcD [Gemmata sp. G18]|uniref:Nuclease SbcCD subunit D n=1 Tax=Gemmata palustris TaxID=2822762 RepID=A0ABS5BVX8_9BACT|nr:exonuclease subunit SbcD [Gemmata palustris]MBP3957851.1 exonuclease subunit SbcD [Gemmata palustris]
MRIVHTADWHLCDRLGRLDRTDDLKRRVEAVARLCEENAADVLLIAGDLFSEQASVDDVTASLMHLRQSFLPFFERKGTVLAVTGNHDRNGRIDIVRAGMGLAVPDAGRGGRLSPGRMYLANNPAVVRLADPAGHVVQFVLLPYPFPSRYAVAADSYASKEEENRLVRASVADWLQRKTADAAFEQTVPTVLVAHLHVRGSELTTAYKMSDRDDVLFDVGELHPDWRYVALGHIHQPQCLGGSETVRYPGSLDRLDFGETHDTHGVVLFDVVGAEPVKPVSLPIPATQFHTITLTDPDAELPTVHEKYPDHATAVVRLRVHPPTATDREEVSRHLKKMFPRWHSLDWVGPTSAVTGNEVKFSPRAGFADTVRAYLTEQLDRENDPDKDLVLALADTFLKPGGPS